MTLSYTEAHAWPSHHCRCREWCDAWHVTPSHHWHDVQTSVLLAEHVGTQQSLGSGWGPAGWARGGRTVALGCHVREVVRWRELQVAAPAPTHRPARGTPHPLCAAPSPAIRVTRAFAGRRSVWDIAPEQSVAHAATTLSPDTGQGAGSRGRCTRASCGASGQWSPSRGRTSALAPATGREVIRRNVPQKGFHSTRNPGGCFRVSNII